MKKWILACLVGLLAVPTGAQVTQLTENGDGTATLTITFATFELMEACAHFAANLSCADTRDWNNDGTPTQWAVQAGHCTQQQADYNVFLWATDPAEPETSATTCDATQIANNRCRDASDLFGSQAIDQTGWEIVAPGVCQNLLRAFVADAIGKWRTSGLVKLYRVENPPVNLIGDEGVQQ